MKVIRTPNLFRANPFYVIISVFISIKDCEQKTPGDFLVSKKLHKIKIIRFKNEELFAFLKIQTEEPNCSCFLHTYIHMAFNAIYDCTDIHYTDILESFKGWKIALNYKKQFLQWQENMSFITLQQ